MVIKHVERITIVAYAVRLWIPSLLFVALLIRTAVSGFPAANYSTAQKVADSWMSFLPCRIILYIALLAHAVSLICGCLWLGSARASMTKWLVFITSQLAMGSMYMLSSPLLQGIVWYVVPVAWLTILFVVGSTTYVSGARNRMFVLAGCSCMCGALVAIISARCFELILVLVALHIVGVALLHAGFMAEHKALKEESLPQ